MASSDKVCDVCLEEECSSSCLLALETTKEDEGLFIRINKVIDNVSRRHSLVPVSRESPVAITTISEKESEDIANHAKDVKTENDDWKLLYKVSDSPPFHMTVLFAFQQTLMVLPFCVMSAIVIAQAVCAGDDNELKTQLLSTTILLASLCTISQTTFGVRLPVFQGPTAAYLVPLLVIAGLPDMKCEPVWKKAIYNATTGENITTDELDIVGYREKVAMPKLRQMQGSLILAGIIHMLIGLTGFVGVLLKIVGPLTVVPTLLLIGFELYGVMNSFCEPNWGVAVGTSILSLILMVYLNGWKMPLPAYTREKGCHIIRYPLHQVLSIMFAILIGWGVCGILTYAGVLTDDRTSKQYKTRTDYGNDAVERTPWFTMPYPGQFGSPGFSGGIFIAFFIATLLSITESMADYFACARISHLPPPPLTAINRGIMIEGLWSMIAGFFGAAHATTTYSNNIGLIGMTGVASRRVLQMLGVQLVLCAVIGKMGAVFVTIPYPVLGGASIISFGVFLGIVLSYLQFVDMNSPRNLAVVGVALITGLMVPKWVTTNFEAIDTGNKDFDKFLIMALTNPSLFGGLTAFILDNTVKGTKLERGIATWSLTENLSSEYVQQSEENVEVYEIPCLTRYFDKLAFMKFIPVFPTFSKDKCRCRSKSPNLA